MPHKVENSFTPTYSKDFTDHKINANTNNSINTTTTTTTKTTTNNSSNNNNYQTNDQLS